MLEAEENEIADAGRTAVSKMDAIIEALVTADFLKAVLQTFLL